MLALSKCLYDFLIADHLINQPGLLCSGLGLKLEHGIGSLCDKSCYKEGHRGDQHNHQSDLHIHGKHKSKCSDNRSHTGK